jgi:hypothetical protein
VVLLSCRYCCCCVVDVVDEDGRSSAPWDANLTSTCWPLMTNPLIADLHFNVFWIVSK